MQTKENLKISVIMNCLNCEKYLKEAIDSVYAQTYKNWEIIFWDNASTDSSAEIAKSYDEKLRYFRGEETIPLGAARNKAIEKARGDIIGFLDCDDIWMPYKLEKQIHLFDRPEVGIVYSNVILFNEIGQVHYVFEIKEEQLPKGKIFRKMLTNTTLPFSTILVAKSVLSELPGGWFDERFDVIEDYDFLLRICKEWEVKGTIEVLSKYRMHSESFTFKFQEKFPEEREMLMCKLKNLYDDFEKYYRDEIDAMVQETCYQHGVAEMRRDNPRKARKYVRPFIFKSSKLSVFFLLTFLPKELFTNTLSLVRKIDYR